MPQIEIDLAVVEQRIKDDPQIKRLEAEKGHWRKRQDDKIAHYAREIAEAREKIKEKRKAIGILKVDISKFEGHIRRCKAYQKICPAGLNRIERRIAMRKRQIKFQELRRKTAAIRKNVMQMIRLT